MTFEARAALRDANIALDMLEHEDNTDRWRVIWFAAITLARTVGHVLEKVDSKNNQDLKTHSDSAFKKWKSEEQHSIFKNFIDKERNSLVKENITSAEGSMDYYGIVFTDENGQEQIESIESALYRPILSGAYQGQDARDVLAEALTWWATELDKIDQLTAATKPPLPNS